MLRLSYLPVNQAWVFTFGKSLIDVDGQWIFNDRAAAVAAAERCGLNVSRNGEVSSC